MPQMIILRRVTPWLVIAAGPRWQWLGGCAGAEARANSSGAEPETTLAPVLVTAPPLMSSSSELMIPGRDFELRPHGRPADVLRLIPGLIINQHQGGGKAEQYLIRGLRRRPRNRPGHLRRQRPGEHAQPRPRTGLRRPALPHPGDGARRRRPEGALLRRVRRLRHRRRGQLHHAATSSRKTRWRSPAAASTLSATWPCCRPPRIRSRPSSPSRAITATGPFDKPNGYLRFNVFGKASTTLAEDMKLSLWASYYHAEWHGSGEIPTRAVRSGLIDRFGAIDPNEGGITQRSNLNLEYRWKIDREPAPGRPGLLDLLHADDCSTTSRSSSTIPSPAT